MANALQNFHLSRRQNGAVLIMGLVFLALLTLLGISAMQVTTMEERMTGNERDRKTAFQAAEAGLRDAEDFLLGKDFYAFNVNCTGALCATGSAPNWRTYAWDGTKDVLSTTTIGGVAEQPRYFSEYAGQVKCPQCGGGWRSAYRLTARAKGGNVNTVAFLEQVRRP